MLIQSIPWETYKRIKSRIIDSIGGEIGKAIASVATSLDKVEKDSGGIGWIAAIARSGIADRIPELLASVGFETDRLIEDLVQGCCRLDNDTAPNLDSLHALDVLKLRNAILDNPELQELFETEKNCYRGVWTSVASLLSLTGTQAENTVSGAGGEAGSTS